MIRVVDLFAGAGGESTGIVQALDGERYDLAAVNHWDIAIQTHRRNHPQARHFQTDVQHLNPHDVVRPTDTIDLLWASPECTHHSVARGGRPRSEQSRASAWIILKWLSEVYVRRVILENVPEFVSWGPLGSDGKLLKSKKGATFSAFVDAMRAMGYRVDWQVLCAADYGDPTTRRRFFLQAVRGREQIRWPNPTHAQSPGLFSEKLWVPAREIIDWSIRGESIFSRKRPLAQATLRRIETGIKRYWGEWAEPFLVLLRGTSTVRTVDEPLPTVTAGGGHVGLIEPFMVPFYGERAGQEPRSHAVSEPLPTVPGSNKFGLVEPFLLQLTHGQRPLGVDRPLPTVTCAHRGEIGVVSPLIMHQCSKGRCRPVDEPTATVLSRGAHSLIEPFIVKYYGTAQAKPLRLPLDSLTTRERFALVEGTVGLDITFRMLQPHELARAQGFPDWYWFAGNKTDQVKQIGNAVPVHTARALTSAALEAA